MKTVLKTALAAVVLATVLTSCGLFLPVPCGCLPPPKPSPTPSAA